MVHVRRGIVIEDYEDVMSEPQEETEEETPEPSAADQKTESPKKPETKDQKDTPQPTAPAEKPTTKTEDGKTGK